MKRVLLRSPAFARDLRSWLKANPEAGPSIQETLEQLSADASHPSLRTHKLRGKLARSWACGAGYEGAEAILLQTLGTHDQVY
jgi:mRNA-degrading endonuclease YafQ of YafQ-DinJ toxin-antitoxin module